MQNNQKVLMLGGGTSSSLLLRLMASSTLVPVDLLSAFAVNDVEAALALSFTTNEYRTGNAETTFADAFMGNSPKLTYSTTSNSTMVNSSGEIVWAPHNLLPYSNDLTNWSNSWGGGITLTANDILGPDGSTYLSKTARIDAAGDGIFEQTAVNLVVGAVYTFEAVVKAGNSSQSNIIAYDVDGVSHLASLSWDWGTPPTTASSSGASNISYTSLGDGYYRVRFDCTAVTAGPHRFVFQPASAAGDSNGQYAYVGQASIYRSDLGGMAPVPGAATGFEYYVPTNGNAEYLPRVGHHVYNGSTWVNEGLLIESEVRTNLVTHSEDFTNASWSKNDVSVTANASSAPDGNVTADRITATTASTDRYVSFTESSTGTHTQSVYVRYIDTQWIQLAHTSSVEEYANFDIQNGVLGSKGSNVSASTIEDVGGGWYRISATHTASSVALWAIAMINSGTDTWLQSNSLTTNVDFWGYQLEAGSTPSSYIPTNNSTVTRGGQSLTVPANWYDADNPTYTGPELVTNGDFPSGLSDGDVGYDNGDGTVDGWTALNSDLSVVSNRLRVTNTAAAQGQGRLAFSTVAGQVYTLSADVTIGTASRAMLFIYNDPGTTALASNTSITSTGTYSLTFTASSTSTAVSLYNYSAVSGEYSDFDNVSVRQVSAPQFGWPEPEYIGPELVTNGGFDTDLTGWDTTTGYSQSAGKAVADGVTSAPQLVQTIGIEANSYYQVTVDVSGWTLGNCYVVLGGVQPANNNLNSNGSYTFYVKPTASTYISFSTPSGTYDGQLDNISVREINPLSVSMQMDGRMTYADEGLASQSSFVNWVLDGSNEIRAALQTFGSDVGQINYIQDESGYTQVEVPSAIDAYSPGVLVPFNISSRHGSTFVNGAVDGVAQTADTTPTALPDLSGTDLEIAYDFMGTIGTFRQFAGDIGDGGLEKATS